MPSPQIAVVNDQFFTLSTLTKELLNSEADGEDVPAIAAALRKGGVPICIQRLLKDIRRLQPKASKALRLSCCQERVIRNSMWALWVAAMENIYCIYIYTLYIMHRGKMEEAEDVPPSPWETPVPGEAACLCWLLDSNPSEGIHCSHCAPRWWDWKVGSPQGFFGRTSKGNCKVNGPKMYCACACVCAFSRHLKMIVIHHVISCATCIGC